jgi:hypothetical protein
MKEAFELLRPDSEMVLLKNAKTFMMLLLGIKGKHDIEKSLTRFEESFHSQSRHRKSQDLPSISPFSRKRQSTPSQSRTPLFGYPKSSGAR